MCSAEKMEIDGVAAVTNKSQIGSDKRQKLNTTNAKILINPAIPDNRSHGIDTQFYDDPFGISREEVSFRSKSVRLDCFVQFW